MDGLAVKCLQDSFVKVFARKSRLADRFYAHLFHQAPETRAMFTREMGHQREMFASMLTSSVRAMADPDAMEGKIRSLRQSHAQLGLTPAQLDAGSNALMASLLEVVGDQLTDDEKSAWAKAIVLVMRAMAPPESGWDGPDQTARQMYFISR